MQSSLDTRVKSKGGENSVPTGMIKAGAPLENGQVIITSGK